MATEHLLTLQDLTPASVIEILDQADALKRQRGLPSAPRPLAAKSVAMIFSKSSTRTRVSFEVGTYELGGYSMFLDKSDLQLGRGETVADTARVLSRYVHGAVIRTHAHAELEEFAAHAEMPVINALTDAYHPCQLLADLQTIRERAGRLAGVKVTYLGDGANNMANSWLNAAALTGLELTIAAPRQYQPDPEILRAVEGTANVTVCDAPAEAVSQAEFIYTDVWVSMGFEQEAATRLEQLQPYQVNEALLAAAPAAAKVMHCLPAHRGQEITDAVMDGPAAIVWDEAENRLHVQKAVLCRLIGGR